MSLKIDLPQSDLLKPKITIFGVGGAGGNAINNMIRSNLEGVEFVAANTDSQSLANSLATNKIQLGLKITKGLGAGSFPDRGRMAAEENIDEINNFLQGCNMVFIAAGMGGGTGTGAAPVIAKLAREQDILTVGVVTKPFHFEGKYRMETAESGIEELKKYVDTLIVIPNQNLFRIANEQTTFESAFKMADDVLHAGVRGITDLITMPGLVNLDFADIRTIMTKMGKAMMGTGEATGENRAVEACHAAISNPLLDDISIKGAKGVLVNMTGGPDMTLFEADIAVNTIKKEVDQNANIIFGSAFSEDMKGKIRISVVATGIESEDIKKEFNKNFVQNEPTRFKVKFDNKFTDDNEQKSFFDPGVSLKYEENDINEIEKAFSNNEQESRNSNINGLQENIVDEDFDIDPKQKDLSKFNFLNDQQKDDQNDILSTNKINRSQQDNTKERIDFYKKNDKKENNGFNLFGFMNSGSKSKNLDLKKDQERSENYEEENLEADYEEIKKSRNHKSQSHNLKAKKSVNLEVKKKTKINEETIFDDLEDNQTSKFDDDILNVPAFFRRKK
jgi:cell division protein FtsZ